MHCCPDCFHDAIIRQTILANSTAQGKCPICSQKDVRLIECKELALHFQPLFELYSNHHLSTISLNISTPVFLYQHLNLFWPKLFNQEKLNDTAIHKLVQCIATATDMDLGLFGESVELTRFIEEPGSQLDQLELQWDYFANEIKTSNRYFLNEMIDTDLLGSVFERLSSTYQLGVDFFRARISDFLLPVNEMGKPPQSLTKGGRANPVGIPYLYLSSDLKTTLYETRISLHESLTIGKFLLKEPLSIVSLNNIKEMGPFEVQARGFDLEEFISYRPYLQKLESELSKPVRKQDVDLDYLPTQFLCEYIKSLGFDAVEYRSAMNPNGFNLAVFNDYKLDCIETKFYSVNKLEYEWEEL
ncbi:MAG: RES family NAD+ phosphorylase [Sphingobacteriaceae bacterium]